ncbi:MAG: tRNA pseudouridine(38-40) synthase TruA [Firmicutes bacterium]|nr:tRNA pseudouridine(38-40) synthase TruA [Bacillota bacterium]
MLTVAYDGTDFHGFARQPELRTVQGVLEVGLSRVLVKPVEVFGASRTDAGVHARHQVVHFDLEDDNCVLPIDRLGYALSRQMPSDLAVLSAISPWARFHARHSVRQKTYRYAIRVGRVRDVFTDRFELHVPTQLNVVAMQEAARWLTGRHDFTSFCFAHAQQDSKIRTLDDIRIVRPDETRLLLEVSGKSFLHNMIRIIMGTLLDVGQGRRTSEDMKRILAQRDRRAAGPTAPARGLTLWDIRYDDSSAEASNFTLRWP